MIGSNVNDNGKYNVMIGSNVNKNGKDNVMIGSNVNDNGKDNVNDNGKDNVMIGSNVNDNGKDNVIIINNNVNDIFMRRMSRNCFVKQSTKFLNFKFQVECTLRAY